MAEVKARVLLKHDTSENWATASKNGFIPKEAEPIFYTDLNKIKVGDGEHTLDKLEFLKGAQDLSLGAGEGKDALVGGVADKSIISSVVGDSLAEKITVNAPAAKGAGSIAFNGGAEAISTGDIALGALVTVGVKGLYYSSIDPSNRTITLSTSRASAQGSNLANNYGWAVGDTISFVNGSQYPAYTKISAINGNVITVEALPADIQTYSSVKESTYLPDDFTIFACYRKKEAEVTVPIIGTVLAENYRWYARGGIIELGWVATALGIENTATGSASVVSGYDNWAAGD